MIILYNCPWDDNVIVNILSKSVIKSLMYPNLMCKIIEKGEGCYDNN